MEFAGLWKNLEKGMLCVVKISWNWIIKSIASFLDALYFSFYSILST